MGTRYRLMVPGFVLLATWLWVADARAQGTAPDGDAQIAARNAAIHAALRQKASVNVIQEPLEQVARSLAAEHNIRISIDERALDDLGIGTDTPVTRVVKQVRLSSLLHLMLDALDLTYVVLGGNLQITTQDEADAQTATRVYAVQDLTSDPLGEPDYVSLTELIRTTIAPEMWDDAGGPGSMAPLRGTLIVTQTQQVHEQVAALLEALRTLRKQLRTARGQARLQAVRLFDSPQEQAVRRALRDDTAQINVNQEPLESLVDFLREKHGVEFQIDERALDDLGIGSDTPVTAVEDDGPLGAALARLLHQLDLACIVQNDVALITTQDWASTILEPRVYPVEDLVAPLEGLGEPDYDALIDAIKSTVAVDTWDDAGGPGSIGQFEIPQCLIIDQTQEVHRQIEQVLKQLRAKSDAAPQSAGSDSDGAAARHGGLSLQTYPVRFVAPDRPSPSSEQLAALIRELIAPASWQPAGPGALEPLRSGLLVRNSPAVQQQVRRLLTAIDAVQPSAEELAYAEELSKRMEAAAAAENEGSESAPPGQLVVPTVRYWQSAWTRQRQGESVVLAVFRITEPPGDEAPRNGEEMERVIRKYVEPDSWGGEKPLGYIRSVPGVLVVEHTAAVQKQVAALLRGVGLLPQQQAAGCGGATSPGAVQNFFRLPSGRP